MSEPFFKDTVDNNSQKSTDDGNQKPNSVHLDGAGASASAPAAGNAAGKPAGDRNALRYSEEDVDKIVQKRLARERAKNEKQQAEQTRDDELNAREHNIEVKERRIAAREAFESLGFEKIPATALKLLRYDTEEEYEQSLADVSQLINELIDSLEVKRATGKTPKAFKQNRDPNAAIKKAFGL